MTDDGPTRNGSHGPVRLAVFATAAFSRLTCAAPDPVVRGEAGAQEELRQGGARRRADRPEVAARRGDANRRDIVAEVDANRVYVIGGNVGASVTGVRSRAILPGFSCRRASAEKRFLR
jgi:hypothetical protein